MKFALVLFAFFAIATIVFEDVNGESPAATLQKAAKTMTDKVAKTMEKVKTEGVSAGTAGMKVKKAKRNAENMSGKGAEMSAGKGKGKEMSAGKGKGKGKEMREKNSKAHSTTEASA